MTLARGLQRKKLDRGVYYVINLAELTRGTILGESLEYWTDAEKKVPRTQEAWTWDALARWLLCMEGLSMNLEAPERDAIIAMFRDEPLNATNLPYLYDAWVPSYVPAASDEDGKDPIASKEPMILVFREENLPRAGFQYWYRRRVLFGTGSNLASATSKEFSYLDDFRKKYLAPLQAANGLVEGKIVKPIAKLAAQLQVGEVLFTALLDFAGPVEQRRARWRRNGVVDPRADTVYVVPPASTLRQNFVRDSSENWTQLAQSLLALARAEVWYGKEAKARDAKARVLLAQLREAGGPVVQMLASPELLTPQDHLKLRTLLADSFCALTKSPWASEALMRAEFAAVAQAASASPAAVPFEAESERERSLALAIEKFDAKKTLPIEEETPLTELILELFKDAKEKMSDWKEKLSNVSFALDLLGLATPFVQRKLFVPGTGVLDVAWGWRALVGSARMDSVNASWVWAELRRLVRRKAPAPGVATEPLLEVDRGKLAKGLDGLSSNVAWKSAKVLLTTILAAEATAELSAETPENAVSGLSIIMSEAKALSDLVTLDPEKCFILSRTTVDSAMAATLTHALEKTPAVELLGPMSDALSFIGSVMEFRSAGRKQSQETREQASEKAILDGLSLAVGAVGFVIGAELALASFAIFIGQNVLLNRDVWAMVLPGVARAPAPQSFLSKVLRNLDTDDLVQRMRHEAELGVAKGGVSTADFDKALAKLLKVIDVPTSDDPTSRTFWDVGGPAGASVEYVNFSAVDVLREYYGFSESAAVDIVRKSNEMEQQ